MRIGKLLVVEGEVISEAHLLHDNIHRYFAPRNCSIIVQYLFFLFTLLITIVFESDHHHDLALYFIFQACPLHS
jgi:hypothetical protein